MTLPFGIGGAAPAGTRPGRVRLVRWEGKGREWRGWGGDGLGRVGLAPQQSQQVAPNHPTKYFFAASHQRQSIENHISTKKEKEG